MAKKLLKEFCQGCTLASFLLRAGLALAVFYAAISAFLIPTSWVGFIPKFVTTIIPANIFLIIYGILEFFLGFWLLSNKKVFLVSILTAILMGLIIIFNLGALDLLFRDVAILFMALALAAINYNK